MEEAEREVGVGDGGRVGVGGAGGRVGEIEEGGEKGEPNTTRIGRTYCTCARFHHPLRRLGLAFE